MGFCHPERSEGSAFVQPTSRFFGLRPQNDNAFWIGQLERAGIDAAVDQEILAGDVPRLDAAQVGAELAELLGSRASEILSRRRALMVDMIHKISEAWKIPADLLVRPYQLERAA